MNQVYNRMNRLASELRSALIAISPEDLRRLAISGVMTREQVNTLASRCEADLGGLADILAHAAKDWGD